MIRDGWTDLADWLYRLWQRINEPRSISMLYFVQYVFLAVGGIWALVDPPRSIEGYIGSVAMIGLSSLLVFGGTVGAIASLPGIYWLERSAVLAVGWACAIYLAIIVTLHISDDGNRMLQASIVAMGLLHQGVRWVRVSERPYRPLTEPIA